MSLCIPLKLNYLPGSYSRLVALYSLVPLSAFLTFLLLALLPTIAYNIPRPLAPHPRYFPFPLPEILTAVSTWSLSHHLRLPIYTLFSFVSSPPLTILLSTTTHVLLRNLLRLAILPVLEIRHGMDYPMPTWQDWAFRRVWWIALGWCASEAIVGIIQGYEQIALYRNVLIPHSEVGRYLRQTPRDGTGPGKGMATADDDTDDTTSHAIMAAKANHLGENEASTEGTGSRNGSGSAELRPQLFRVEETAIKVQVERDLDALIALKEREELEAVYGVPAIVNALSLPVPVLSAHTFVHREFLCLCLASNASAPSSSLWV
jgi:hypothetical protein